MKKRMIAIVIGVMLVFSMTACGADTKEAEPVAAMTEEAAEEPVEETAEEPAAEEATEEAAEETTEEATETENETTEEAAEEETAEEEAEEETAANDIYEGLEYDADADAYYYTVVDTEGVTLKSMLIPAGLEDKRLDSLKDKGAVKILDTEYVIDEYAGKTWYGADILAIDCVEFEDGSRRPAFVIEDNGSLIYGDYCSGVTDEDLESIKRVFDTDSNMAGFTKPTEGDSAETSFYWFAGYEL